jgi:peptidoglycan/LPS O-acetylase OafA/YrhL
VTSDPARENNFNLIRMIAASAVLVSHSFALATGDAANEPLRASLGMTFGTIAVDIFFITSGFLVSESILRRGSMRQFMLARVLRIYPGLLVATLLTALACSVWFTTLSFAEFWRSPQTWKFIAKNATLVAPSGIEYRLPFTFVGNPWSKADGEGGSVNSSLWTLPLELRMYIALVLAFGLVRLVQRTRVMSFELRTGLRTLCAALGVTALPLDVFTTVAGRHDLTLHLFTMFFVGAALQYFGVRRHLRAGLALALGAAIVAAAFVSRPLFSALYTVSLAYVVLAVAYLPRGPWLRFNRLGDYSYGTYIYAFPVQQAVAFWWPGIGPWGMTALALPVTLALAVASWRWVEKPALAFKPQPQV